MIALLSKVMPSAALRPSASFVGILQKRDLQVTEIVTAKQTQFGGADWFWVLASNPACGASGQEGIPR